MKNNLIKFITVFMAVAFMTLQSCEKGDLIETEHGNNDLKEIQKKSSSENTLFDFSGFEIINGMCVFESIETLQKKTELMMQISSKELNKQEINFLFLSQQRILEQAIQKEESYFEQFDENNMTKQEIKDVIIRKEKIGYSDFTKKNIDYGIIHVYESEDNDISCLELSVVSWVNPRFLNIDGMVKIGDIIYQFTPTQCKQLTNGDFDQLELLKNTHKNEQNKNIVIGNLVQGGKYHGMLGGGYKENGENWGSKRIEAEIWLRRWDYPQIKHYMYYLKYINYKHRWGDWRADSKADTHGYASATATWNNGSQYGYKNFSDTNVYSRNYTIIFLNNIPVNTQVSFHFSYGWFKRNDVTGINLTNSNIPDVTI